MADAVDGVARGAAEGVVIARQVEVILPFVGAVADDVVSVEVRDDARRSCFGQVANAVVGYGDCRGRVGVGRQDELPGVVVGVVGYDTARPSATSEFAVGGIVVARPL